MKIVINKKIDKSITDEISSKFQQEWTLDELKDKCGTCNLREQYPYQITDDELPNYLLHNGMKEYWIQNPERKQYKYEVSNYGRVRWNGEILKQIFHEKQGNGWLVLEKYPSVYVYRLVAEYWLQPPKESGWEIHHINNDGNDNCIDNLIYLSPYVHRKMPK